MRAIYVVGNQRFVAATYLEATEKAVEAARDMLKRGLREEAVQLYQDALQIRRNLEAAEIFAMIPKAQRTATASPFEARRQRARLFSMADRRWRY